MFQTQVKRSAGRLGNCHRQAQTDININSADYDGKLVNLIGFFSKSSRFQKQEHFFLAKGDACLITAITEEPRPSRFCPANIRFWRFKVRYMHQFTGTALPGETKDQKPHDS